MYQPKKYKKQDPDYIFKFINEHPFATIVLQGERLLATHIPILTEGNSRDFILFGHIANFNEMLPFLKDGSDVLIIFHGANAYVSSSWYKEKDISTWDYSAVHVNSKVRIQSIQELKNSLNNLVQKFEKKQEKPLFYRDLPTEMLTEHLPLITGFWCDPIKIEAVAKLHQTYKSEDVASVIDHLEQGSFSEKELSRDIKKEHD